MLELIFTQAKATIRIDVEDKDSYQQLITQKNLLGTDLENYRKTIFQQIPLRLPQKEYGNLASARLYYKTSPESDFAFVDIVSTESNDFLWSSNQQISRALKITNVRTSNNSLEFDEAFHNNLLISDCLPQSTPIPKINCTINKAFFKESLRELLHSEQFITYMLTNKLKIPNEQSITDVVLTIFSRYSPCRNCYKVLTSENIWDKIYRRWNVSQPLVNRDIIFFFINASDHDPSQKNPYQGVSASSFYLIHPKTFIIDYRQLLSNTDETQEETKEEGRTRKIREMLTPAENQRP